ncbi:MAG: hypothetical protein ACYCZJ_13225 [Sulfuriferula sp.]
MSDWGITDSASYAAGIYLVPVSGAANTKGAWLQVIASTPQDYSGLWVQLRGATTNNSLFDIAIGAAGSEIVVAPNLFCGPKPVPDSFGSLFTIPQSIPAGTRVAVRAQSDVASVNCNIMVGFFAGSFTALPPAGNLIDMGTDLTTSRGTALVIPASGSSAWTQLIAATPADIKKLIIFIGGAGAETQATLDFAVGAAGAEQIIMGGVGYLIRATSGTIGQSGPSLLGPLPIPIPSGSRLSMRATFVGGTGETTYVSILGIT